MKVGSGLPFPGFVHPECPHDYRRYIERVSEEQFLSGLEVRTDGYRGKRSTEISSMMSLAILSS